MSIIYKKIYNLPINILRGVFLILDISVDLFLVTATLLELLSILTLIFFFIIAIISGYLTYNAIFLCIIASIVICLRNVLLEIFPNYLSSLISNINKFLYSKLLK